jgi:predicted PurR-regulated permease PerM
MGIDIKKHLTPPVLLVLFLVIVSLMIVFPVLNMIILGAILAYGVRPVARKIQSKLKYSSLSILLAMIVILVPLILLVAYIVMELIAILSGASSSATYADINGVLSSLSSYLPWSFDVNSISSSLNCTSLTSLHPTLSAISTLK